MSIRNLDKILNPKRVAVIGASNKPGGVGHTVQRNLITGGFSGFGCQPFSESAWCNALKTREKGVSVQILTEFPVVWGP